MNMQTSRTTSSSTTRESLFRGVVAVLFGAAAVFAVTQAVTSNKYVVLSVVMLPVAVLLVNRLGAWLMLTLALFHSWIYVPGFPTALALFYVMAMCMVPVLLARRLLKPAEYPERGALHFIALAYLVVVLVTIYFRGFGVRLLGGDKWGGAGYIHLMIAIPFYLLVDCVLLNEKQWKIVIALFFAAVVVPALAEALFLLSGGSLTWQYFFVRPEASAAIGSLSILQGGSGVLRFQATMHIPLLFTMLLALLDSRRHRLGLVIGCVIAFAFAGISGHRIAVLYVILLIPTAMFFMTGRIPGRLLVGFAVGLICLGTLLHFFGRSLPLAVQRGFSWVPFASISMVARESASGTTEWRFTVWKQVWALLPDYWLIGRGFAFDAADLLYLPYSRTPNISIDWAVITHNYHSGPLSLLIDLGVFGLLVGSALLFGGVVKHYRKLSVAWATESLARGHAVLLASFTVDVILFQLVHGEAAASIVSALVHLTILDGLCRTNRAMLAAQEKAAVPSAAQAI